MTKQLITVELEDPFSGIPFERTVETADSQQVGQLRKSITNLGPLALNTEQTSLEGTSLPTTPRNMVSNFFSGIRQRKWTTTEDQANKSGFLSSFNLGLSSASRSKSIKSLPETSVAFDNNSLNLEYLNNLNNLDDNSSVSDLEDYKEFDSNEDKLYGTDLYEDLPLNERKAKFDEQISKYQSSIDMMTKLKTEMDKELEILVSSVQPSEDKSSCFQNHSQVSQLKSQIKNLEEQMKSVVFLLMQCQIGLETCGDLHQGQNLQEADSQFTTAGPGAELPSPEFSIDPSFEPKSMVNSVLTHRKRTDTEKTETETSGI